MTKQQLNRWEQAVEQISARNRKGVEDQLRQTYAKALRDIKKQLKDFIDEYETLSFSQRMEADRLVAIVQQVQEQFNNANTAADTYIHQHKAEQIEAGYYGSWYAMEEAHAITVGLPILNKRFVEELVYNKVDGKRLSTRLYDNTQKIANVATEELIQGTIRGDGYKEIAARIEEQTEATYKQALRIALTEAGQSQSAAKQKEYEEAKKKGIVATKTWLATLDGKTRHNHQVMDGQTVEIEENFTLPSGQTTTAPGLSGIASEDINCRCTTIKNVDGVPPELRRDNVTGKTIGFKSYKEWAEEKGIVPPAELIRPKKAAGDISLKKRAIKKVEKTVEESETKIEFVNLEKTPTDLYGISNTEFVKKGLTEREEVAITNYVRDGYRSINGYLRGDEKPAFNLDTLNAQIRDIDSAIQRGTIQENIKTFRGINDRSFLNIDPEKGRTTFVEKGFMSTSPYPNASSYISLYTNKKNSALLEIDIPKGTKGVYVDGLFDIEYEDELLLEPGLMFEFIEERKSDADYGGKDVIHLRVIPDKQEE